MRREAQKGYLLLEIMILSALLMVMMTCAFFWQQSAKRIERDGCEVVAAYLAEGALSEMENAVMVGDALLYDKDVVQNNIHYRIMGAGESISDRLYKVRVSIHWMEDGTSRIYEGERLVWVNAEK